MHLQVVRLRVLTIRLAINRIRFVELLDNYRSAFVFLRCIDRVRSWLVLADECLELLDGEDKLEELRGVQPAVVDVWHEGREQDVALADLVVRDHSEHVVASEKDALLLD